MKCYFCGQETGISGDSDSGRAICGTKNIFIDFKVDKEEVKDICKKIRPLMKSGHSFYWR